MAIDDGDINVGEPSGWCPRCGRASDGNHCPGCGHELSENFSGRTLGNDYEDIFGPPED